MNANRRRFLQGMPLAVGAAGIGLPSAVLAKSTEAAGWPRAAVEGVPGAPTNGVSPALELTRRHLLDENVNMLTFHSMDQLFYTRDVPYGGPVWELPRADQAMTFHYSFKGSNYTPDQFFDRTFTNALLIIKNGRIVGETYRNLTGPDTHFVSFSMAKSFTSLLYGLALRDGYIRSLEDQVVQYVPELMGSGYEGVTLKQVLQMRSGVAYDERYDFTNDSPAQHVFEYAIVRNAERFADMAPHLKRGTEPGSTFNYSTMDTAVLGWVLERALRQTLAEYMSVNIWQPLGMESHGFYMMDGPPGVGRELNGMGYNAILRDYGRLGQMMLQKGQVRDIQVVPTDWIAISTASVPIGTPPGKIEGPPMGYGLQWWTFPEARTFAALGLQGQFIYVDPHSETVVVKLSYFPPANMDASAETLSFFQAASNWKA